MSGEIDEQGQPSPTGAGALLEGGAAVGHWVLDPAGSRVEFHVKHFWGAVTVHGSFGEITGEGDVGADGSVTGKVVVDAASLSTRNAKRDDHLRSAEFFDVEEHPHVVVTVTTGKLVEPATLACSGTLDAAGYVKAIKFAADVVEATTQAVTLRTELVVDRTEFDMTWSPLGMTSPAARAKVLARFVRA